MQKTTQNRLAVINRKNIATYGLGAAASTALMSSNANALDISAALTGDGTKANIDTAALFILGIAVTIFAARRVIGFFSR
ncbi:MAG: putative membrane protein [Inoviridae sp.]|nr:MAG: putative membrane protein [Inoviridae sp.]